MDRMFMLSAILALLMAPFGKTDSHKPLVSHMLTQFFWRTSSNWRLRGHVTEKPEALLSIITRCFHVVLDLRHQFFNQQIRILLTHSFRDFPPLRNNVEVILNFRMAGY